MSTEVTTDDNESGPGSYLRKGLGVLLVATNAPQCCLSLSAHPILWAAMITEPVYLGLCALLAVLWGWRFQRTGQYLDLPPKWSLIALPLALLAAAGKGVLPAFAGVLAGCILALVGSDKPRRVKRWLNHALRRLAPSLTPVRI